MAQPQYSGPYTYLTATVVNGSLSKVRYHKTMPNSNGCNKDCGPRCRIHKGYVLLYNAFTNIKTTDRTYLLDNSYNFNFEERPHYSVVVLIYQNSFLGEYFVIIQDASRVSLESTNISQHRIYGFKKNLPTHFKFFEYHRLYSLDCFDKNAFEVSVQLGERIYINMRDIPCILMTKK